jgi:hypothetical protein
MNTGSPIPTSAAPSRRAFLAILAAARLNAQGAALKLTDEQIEKFLLEAEVEGTRSVPVGVTLPDRATLFDGTLRHDAQIQTIDERKAVFQVAGATEFNFRDAWQFNVAAYRLGRLLGLDMIPVSVERRWKGKKGAFTWWIDDVIMMEADRLQKNVSAPDGERWNAQMHIVRIFDQLIYNVDRNLQNIVIDKDWKLWMVDHTRAFRTHKQLKNEKDIQRCERRLLARLRELKKDEVEGRLSAYLARYEIDGVMARRDLIVKLVDEKVAKQGEAQVLYDGV